MAPVLWIHCNRCYYLFSRKDRRFYHLSCLHVLCKKCMALTDRGTVCPICNRKRIQFIEICNTMDKQFKALYDPNPTTPIETARKALYFQQKQKMHLVRQIVLKEEEYTKVDEIEHILRKKIFDSQKKLEKARNYRHRMQETFSPTFHHSNPPQQHMDFFDAPSSSSRRSRHCSDYERHSDSSFLNMKSSSSSSSSSRSLQSIDFCTTPINSSNSNSAIDETFLNMTLNS